MPRDAEIVRYDGVTKPGRIADYFRDYLADRAGLRLQLDRSSSSTPTTC